MKIPFTKAHGAKNDFLLTWRSDAPEDGYPEIARAICDRHTGIGADGWMLVDPPRDAEAEGAIELYNSDGSAPEISGNGTRCAAAFLIENGMRPPASASAPAPASRPCACWNAQRRCLRVRDEYGDAAHPRRAYRSAACQPDRATSL